jgi:GNAT superfamily N-acetyltransferase
VQRTDAEALVAIRIAAMRESLERIGRFDAQRVRERFLAGFDPTLTRFVVVVGARVGFVVVRPQDDGLLLDHLYIVPSEQGRGVGTAVMADVLADADARRLRVRVGALRESASNRFYERHGFEPMACSEWDNHYERPVRD